MTPRTKFPPSSPRLAPASVATGVLQSKEDSSRPKGYNFCKWIIKSWAWAVFVTTFWLAIATIIFCGGIWAFSK